MLTRDNWTFELEHFDSHWYLQAYPDVAEAKIDPFEHFSQHGHLEGRLPHRLESKDLEDKLLYGFHRNAASDLIDLYSNTNVSPYERAYSAWALARWHIAFERWDQAVPLMNYAHSTSCSPYSREIVTTCLVEGLLQKKDYAGATSVLKYGITHLGKTHNLHLAAANILSSVAPNVSSRLQLDAINKIYQNNICELSLIDPKHPVSIDNLQGAITPKKYLEGSRVTAIISAYNSARFITTAITGLLNQTWSNLEILVVDDGSTDDTSDVVNRLCANHNNIKLFTLSKNCGAYAARNFALKHATGDFIVNHDSDDWSHPQRIQLQVEYLTANPRVLGVMTSWARVDENLYFPCWRTDVPLIHASISTIMFRKSLISSIGTWDVAKAGADSEYLNRIRISFGNSSIVEIHKDCPLAFARILPSSLTNNQSTHLLSQHGGARAIYSMLSSHLHNTPSNSQIDDISDRIQALSKIPRSLRVNSNEITKYDIVFFADLTTAAFDFAHYETFSELFQHGYSVGIFHWPHYHDSAPLSIDPRYLDSALDGVFQFVVHSESVSTRHLVVLSPTAMSFQLIGLPRVSYDQCYLHNPDKTEILKSLKDDDILNEISIIRSSSLFSDHWYNLHYPDVVEAGIDPVTHYVKHGAAEGRNPGPNFDSSWYRSCFTRVGEISCSPLAHYLRIGQNLGLDPSYPIIAGVNLLENRPCILLCGHASGFQLFGAELSLLDILDAYAANAINVIVTIPESGNKSYIDKLRKKAHKIYVVPYTLWDKATLPCPYAISSIKSIIEQNFVRFVHVNTIMLREPLLAARAISVTTAIHLRESLKHDSAICNKLGLGHSEIVDEVQKSADILIANSEFTYQTYFKKNSTFLVRNTVNQQIFDLENIVDPNRINIALISSNLPKKGIFDFINIAQALEYNTANAFFLIIGPENEHIINLKNTDHLLPTNLRVCGYFPTPEDAIRHSNIVMNLSHFEETFGRTVIEALAAGRPVIAYEHGALKELVTHEQDGFLVPYMDIDAAAAMLKHLCESPCLINSMGQSGRSNIKKKYENHMMPQQLAVVLERALAITKPN